jgi:protein-tyrosine phosphatase
VTLLPPGRDGHGPYRIAVVCLGNICRSPMAAVVLEAKIAASSLSGRVEVRSSGTGDWHVGDRMDGRAAATLTDAGYDADRHRAQQFDHTWFGDHDLVLAMDRSNRRNVTALARGGNGDRVRLFRQFDPEAGDDLEVPDPWYGGQDGFDEVLAIVERTSDELVAQLCDHLGGTR